MNKMSKNDFDHDIEKFVKPVINGVMNPCCGDGYYHVSLVRKYGKDRVSMAIEEYRKFHG